MAKKCTIDIKLKLRPDIKYKVVEESSFWTGDVKIDNSLWIGKPGGNSWDSYFVCLGYYDENVHNELLRFLLFLDTTFQHCCIAEMRELAGNSKLKRILKSMDGLNFRIEVKRGHYLLRKYLDSTYVFEGDDGKISKVEVCSGYNVEEGLFEANSWNWETNIYKFDNNISITCKEFNFLKTCIQLSFLQNLAWVPISNHRVYYRFKYNEDCIERAIQRGWIK